jgi:hypothetical protein
MALITILIELLSFDGQVFGLFMSRDCMIKKWRMEIFS